MSFKPGGRSSQVRPRPPSTGRPVPSRPRPRLGGTVRVSPRRLIEEERAGLPLPAKVLLGLAVVGLVGAVLLASTGLLGRAVSGFGDAVGGMFEGEATPSPSPTLVAAPDVPILDPPDQAYTNSDKVDLTGSVPSAVVGKTEYTVRIYGGLRDAEPTQLAEVPVGETTAFAVPDVTLQKGVNIFTATLVGPGGESDPSRGVSIVLDTSAPKVTIISPAEGDTVNAASVTITGKTQGRSNLLARNDASGSSISGLAEPDGTFELKLGIVDGPNKIVVESTDLAGNIGSAEVTVRRGSGTLAAKLTISAYRITLASLPRDIVATVVVSDPDGKPLADIALTFTISIPGLPTISADQTTDASGSASFQTTIPEGATAGAGLVTVLVTTEQFGQTTARSAFTLTE